jgi:hypothetical protein
LSICNFRNLEMGLLVILILCWGFDKRRPLIVTFLSLVVVLIAGKQVYSILSLCIKNEYMAFMKFIKKLFS